MLPEAEEVEEYFQLYSKYDVLLTLRDLCLVLRILHLLYSDKCCLFQKCQDEWKLDILELCLNVDLVFVQIWLAEFWTSWCQSSFYHFISFYLLFISCIVRLYPKFKKSGSGIEKVKTKAFISRTCFLFSLYKLRHFIQLLLSEQLEWCYG